MNSENNIEQKNQAETSQRAGAPIDPGQRPPIQRPPIIEPPPPPPIQPTPPPSMPVGPTPTIIEKVSGDNQEGEATYFLMNPFVVRVQDAAGGPMEGVLVNFTATPNSAELRVTSALTDSEGKASTYLKLGNTAGVNIVTAIVDGLSEVVSFSAIAYRHPSEATTVEKVSGDNQEANIRQQLPDPVVVRVLDQYGHPMQGVSVEYSIISVAEIVRGAPTRTDENGYASITISLTSAAGIHIIRPSINGVYVPFWFTARAIDPSEPEVPIHEPEDMVNPPQTQTPVSDPDPEIPTITHTPDPSTRYPVDIRSGDTIRNWTITWPVVICGTKVGVLRVKRAANVWPPLLAGVDSIAWGGLTEDGRGMFCLAFRSNAHFSEDVVRSYCNDIQRGINQITSEECEEE